VEIEELRQRLKDAEASVASLTDENRVLSDKYERLKRLYEYLLMLAVESGVSPSELEKIQEQILILDTQDSSTLKEA
jgi:predicted nuclease with TOPRIM domain